MAENYNQNYYYYGNNIHPNYGIHQNLNYPYVHPFYAMSPEAPAPADFNPVTEAILSTLTVTRIVKKKSHKIETIDIASTSEDEDEDDNNNPDTKYVTTQGQISESEYESPIPPLPPALPAVPDRVLAPEPEPEPALLQRKLSLPQAAAAAAATNNTKRAIPASVIVTNAQTHHRNNATSFSISRTSTPSHDQFQSQNQSQGHIFYRNSKKIKKENENIASRNLKNLNSESNPASKLGSSPSTPSHVFTSYSPKIWWPKMNVEKFRVPSKKVVNLTSTSTVTTRTSTNSDGPISPSSSPEKDEHHHGQAPDPKMANSNSATVVVSNKFGGMYECPICSKMCTTAKVLKNHMLIHDKMYRLRYACDVCPQRYSKFRPLESHLKTKHGRDYLCSGCQNSFQNEKDYTQHCAPLQIQVVIENGSNIATSAVRNQVECSKCFKPFPNQCQLNKHAKTHVDMVQEKETEITVPSKVLETIDIDGIDVDQDHNSNSNSSSNKNPAGESSLEIQKVPLIDLYPEYPCHHCEKIFDRETFLSEHLRMQHKGWGWSCSLCSANFESSFRIKAHLREAHSIMAAQFKDFAVSLNPQKKMCRKRRVRGKGSIEIEEDESGGGKQDKIIPNNNKNRKIRRNRKNQNGEITSNTSTTTSTSQSSNQKDKEVNAGAGGSSRVLFKCELCQPIKYYKMFSGLKSHYSKLHSDVVVSDVDLGLRV